MQTCSLCHTQSADASSTCAKCGADLHEFSEAAQALLRLRANPRVSAIRVVMAQDACPTCQEHAHVFSKETAPVLPVAGCSHARGCRCSYEPILSEIYP